MFIRTRLCYFRHSAGHLMLVTDTVNIFVQISICTSTCTYVLYISTCTYVLPATDCIHLAVCVDTIICYRSVHVSMDLSMGSNGKHWVQQPSSHC